jgi:hypothetical protein
MSIANTWREPIGWCPEFSEGRKSGCPGIRLG